MKQRETAAHGHQPIARPGPFFNAGSRRAVPGVSPSFFQPKLTIGLPGDRFEREADRVADQVVSQGSAPAVQRACAKCVSEREVRRQPLEENEELLQSNHDADQADNSGGGLQPELEVGPHADQDEREADGLAGEVVLQGELHRQPLEEGEDLLQRKSWGGSTGLVRRLQTAQGGGQSLPAPVLQDMSNAFERDFAGVRVHTDDSAALISNELAAEAFTHGRDIFFNRGRFAPESESGRRLLAHELTHVVQQTDPAAPSVQKADLTSPRLIGTARFEDVLNNREVIEWGDSGTEVRRIQQMLMDLGYDLSEHGADGIFRSETRAAVRAFQRDSGLSDDGRIGFRTLAAIDALFPSFSPPSERTDPWSMECVLSILCPWNRYLVEDVLPTYNLKTFNSRSYPTETWNGTAWVAGTFHSGGYRSPSRREIGLLNSTTCEEFAFTAYHEGWHAIQPSSLATTEETEVDAYISAEQWAIDIGVPGQTFVRASTGTVEDLRTTSGGRTTVDEVAATDLVRQEYGGVSSVPGETVIARVGAADVRVRRSDGSEYERPAAVGDRIRGPTTMDPPGGADLDPAAWDCSAVP